MDFDHEYAIEDFCTAAAVLGFDVDPDDVGFSGFWSQSDGASFTGSYQYVKGAAKRIRAEYPRDTELHSIADMLQELQRRNFYQITAGITRIGHRYAHENTIHCGWIERDSSNYRDPTCDAEETLTDAARRLSQWLYANLETEYEYQYAWQAGQSARDAARDASDAAREYVATVRAFRDAWRARHACGAAVVRRLLRDVAAACETLEEARDYAQEKRRDAPSRGVELDVWRDGYGNA